MRIEVGANTRLYPAIFVGVGLYRSEDLTKQAVLDRGQKFMAELTEFINVQGKAGATVFHIESLGPHVLAIAELPENEVSDVNR